MKIIETLQKIQKTLNAPKNQYNKFGNYNYRNCEDILEALKPLLAEHKASVILSDEIVQRGDRFYVRATATLYCGEEKIEACAEAREPSSRKGMDEAQVTGATSSYARKYALNGLFAIDDNKDPDTPVPPKNTATDAAQTGKKADKTEYILEPDVKRLVKLCRENGVTQKSVCERFGVSSLRGLTTQQYETICNSFTG